MAFERCLKLRRGEKRVGMRGNVEMRDGFRET
jgi:hypothetical protein